ncbi:PAS domain-containing protein [Geomonas oryzisoli]|uniref:histidine kinase n=1 Tax=Geomonas oryzisoli TaxID=2847992 RepID=A0ABX8J0E6_9BACT|nr:ATP-binding protein [Geomonas oryzisoli]QWV91703.1 PAS domain-containing protein [Geomonas oryzisoli]
MEPSAAPDFKKLFEKAPGLYLVLDPQLRAVAATDAYLEATLTTREGIIGKHIFEIFPDNPDDPSADSVRNSRASFNRVVQTRQPDTIGLQRHDVRRPDGGGFEVRYWSAVNYPVLAPDGSLAYILHKVENVTEFMELKRKGVEQAKITDELRERSFKIEADLYERSREMAETSQKLKAANEELARLYEKTRELDTLKTQFFANVSHELRTPLSLILGPVRKLMNADRLDRKQRGDLAVVERNARLLLKNVNDLLDLSKLDAGKIDMEYARTDLAWLTRFVASHFETVADDKGIRFTITAPDELWGEVDSQKLQRVLVNLLGNAFKFTPPRGAIRLTLAPQAESALFVVEDTGPGIPAELRQAVFERFRQVDSGPTRSHGGSGLGLAIVREFVALHRGTVAVTAAPEGGARFSVSIPLAAPEGTAVAATRKVHPLELDETEGTPPVLTSERDEEAPSPSAPLVLVVEDNPDMNDFIRSILQEQYRVSSASNGVEGLEKALSSRPDLVVTDYMMPKMTGEDLVKEIRRHPDFDEMPILLLTAKVDEKLRVHLLQSGVQDALDKPFEAEEFLARVTGLIARKRKSQAALWESHALLKAVTEGIDNSIFIKDAQGRYQLVNGPGARRIGKPVAEIIGQDDEALFDPAAAEHIKWQDKIVMTKGEMLTFEETRLVEGKPRTYLTTKAPHLDANGEVIGVLGISHDITERKLAEEELQKSKDLLEERVKERTTELRKALQVLKTETEERLRAVEELRRREQMLMQQNRLAAMGEMLVNISHQWRQPLNVLAAILQTMAISHERGTLSGEILHKNVNRSVELIEHMSKTINDFSFYLTPDKTTSTFDVSEVVTKTIAMVGETMHDVQVEVQCPEEEVTATGYRNEYAQALLNILFNARDALRDRATPDPKVTIRVSGEGGKSVLTITDNAGGIPEEIMDKIFEPYFSTKGPDKGTGIGLFMSKTIIEQSMGGKLTARNREGGAEFTIEV